MFFFKKYIYLIGPCLLFSMVYAYAQEYNCVNETSLSGLIQDKKKFLKESEYFDIQNIFEFTRNYTKLTEKQKSREKNIIFQNHYVCTRQETGNNAKIYCNPESSVFSYSIIFSENTMRFKKRLITDHWLEGKGDEIDYIHIAHGSCYKIN